MDFIVMGQKKRLYDYPEHTHEYWEVIINIEGTGIAVVDGQEYVFCPGTIFCIRPGIVHSKRAEGGFVDGSVLIADFCFEHESENMHVFQDDERQSFYSLYKVAFEYPVNPDGDIYAEHFLRHIVAAMQDLLSHWKYAKKLNPEILRVQRYMAEHVTDMKLDLDHVIHNTGYTPNYFRKLFRDQCGYSPIQYYNRLKIQLAKQLIHRDKAIMTLNEIGRNCGFEDPYYFSRVFKKVTGLSPMQYYIESGKMINLPIAKKDRSSGEQ